jgi:pantoate--beta-alanine ligase
MSIRVISSPQEMRAISVRARCAGQSIGLVPTMGALHAGHLRLVEAARGESDLVVLSLFVNPAQFGPAEDFDRYPRDLERDRTMAEEAGVDVLFAPDGETMYPGGLAAQRIWVDPGELATHLCGASRPGHFRGVVTVLTKLFHLVEPDRAYFGQKDGQQVLLVRRLAADLAFPLEIRVVPTVREPDGLALSSRNVYLSAEERCQATVLYRALEAMRTAIEGGERDAGALRTIMRDLVAAAPAARLDYAEVVDLESLQPVEGKIETDVMAALAVFFGATRLIDNVMVRFEHGAPRFS